jgi:exodeoxyribonuclease VII small subunit
MNPVTSLTFEEALAEVESITQKLEKGQAPLAEALTLHARAQELLAYAERQLAPLTTPAPVSEVR